MNFKNYLLLKEEEAKQQNFCYMLYPQQPYIDYITEIKDSLLYNYPELFKNSEPLPPEEYHTTVRYVKLNYGQSPDKFVEYLQNNKLPELTAYTQSYKILGEDSFVMYLDSPELDNWYEKINNWLTTSGGYNPSDYITFKPHVSLFYEYKSSPNIPKFNIRTDRIKIKFSVHKVSKNKNGNFIFDKVSDNYKRLGNIQIFG